MGIEMTIKEYTAYYYDTFMDAYANVTTVLSQKPKQIVFEEENSLSHLVAFLHSDEQDIKNLERAKSHLERASLDAYKLVAIEYQKRLKFYTSIDEKNVALAFNLDNQTVYDMLNELNCKLKSIRLIESQNIGKSNSEVVDGYGKCVDIGRELLSHIDYNKIETYTKFSLKNIIYNQGFGIIAGIISGVLATILYNYFT